MKQISFTDDEYRRGLAWLRRQVLLTGDVEGEELLDCLEVDRPCRNVVPIASRRADVDDPRVRLAKAFRVEALERLGQDAARVMLEEANASDG